MTSELKPDLSSFGYADGGYMSKCSHCKETFIGAKRAWSCEPCATKKSLEPKIEQPKPDVPDVLAAQELVRYSVEVLSSGHPYMNSDVDGDYVFHSQAAKIIAAKDKEIEEWRDIAQSYTTKFAEASKRHKEEIAHFNGVKGVNTQYSNALANLGMTEDDDPETFASFITDKLEEIAQYEAQEPVGYTAKSNLHWLSQGHYGSIFVSAEKSTENTAPLYAAPISEKD